jgi:hypothetical protein
MYDVYADLQADREDLVVELAEAAYGFALRHGFRGTFIEVELGLWHALRSCQGRTRSSRRPRSRPDHPPVQTFAFHHPHDRGPTMWRHPRSHGIDVRRGLLELLRAGRRQTLGLDEPGDHLLTSVEVFDEAIEQLYGGRRRADCRLR